MKILNICLTGPFSDGWNYQDNILTKYQVRNGNEVCVVAPKWSWNSDGDLFYVDKDEYENSDGVKIIRLKMKRKENINNRLKKYFGVYELICKIKPDIIFVHGCQFLDIKYIIKYAKNNKVKVFVDNHADFSNSAKTFISKNILHKSLWKYWAKKIEPYVEKFYGVLPARVDFLVNLYKLPKEKVDLLVMGADDDNIIDYCNDSNYYTIREKYNLKDNDFVIVTGGKIDKAKLQTLTFMKAIKKINNKKIKLFIFGSIDKSVKNEFDDLCDDNIKYLGWADTKQSYEWFNMSDLVVFPGRHSVYWEQVVAIGKPMICKYWDGTTHIDIGGNVLFTYDDSLEEYVRIVHELLTDNLKKYKQLLEKASSDNKKMFLYSEIAKKSIR